MTLGWKLLIILDMALNIVTFLMMSKLGIAFYRYSKIMADPKMKREKEELIAELSKRKIR